MSTLNEWQKVACDSYAGGTYRDWKDEDYEEAGDTLFVFIMRELASTEDCDSFDTAIRRMNSAHHDINQLIVALVKAREAQKKPLSIVEVLGKLGAMRDEEIAAMSLPTMNVSLARRDFHQWLHSIGNPARRFASLAEAWELYIKSFG